MEWSTQDIFKMHPLVLTVTFCLLSLPILGQEIFWDSLKIQELEVHSLRSINTEATEFSPHIFGENLGFVYSVPSTKNIDNSIDETYFDLSYIHIDSSQKIPFSSAINTSLHEGPFHIVGNEIFFSRVVKTNNTEHHYTQKIFSGNLLDLNFAPLWFCSDSVTVCHPTLSSDGKQMIFAADFSNQGHLDLYETRILSGNWTKPIKLPRLINSSSNDFFPNLYQDSIIIFASDRPNGFGGYDLYGAIKYKNQWKDLILFSPPLNSRKDDFGLVISDKNKKGYFSSNRDGGAGKDDIYYFRFESFIRKSINILTQLVEFALLDKLNFSPISNAKITITPFDIAKLQGSIEENNVDFLPGTSPEELHIKLSNPENIKSDTLEIVNYNKASIALLLDQSYIIVASSPDYQSSTFLYNYSTYGTKINIILEPVEKQEVVENKQESESKVNDKIKSDELILTNIPKEKGAVVVFNNVYFHSNSPILIEESTYELDELATVLLQHPSMEILLAAHTDSRGEKNFNQLLSEERALEAKQYLVNKGIHPRRIITKGYGETQIRNRCKNGVDCNPEEHQYNRRTEIKILKI